MRLSSFVTSDKHAGGVEQISDGSALGQEFGIGENLKKNGYENENVRKITTITRSKIMVRKRKKICAR